MGSDVPPFISHLCAQKATAEYNTLQGKLAEARRLESLQLWSFQMLSDPRGDGSRLNGLPGAEEVDALQALELCMNGS